MISLKPGRIVYAVVRDSRGINRKRRPVILLSDPRQITAGQTLIGVAVSTKPQDPLPELCVRLPSNHRKQGSTRLPERCVAVCDWLVQFHEEDIVEQGGLLYGELLFQILEKSKAYFDKAQPPVIPPPEEHEAEPNAE